MLRFWLVDWFTLSRLSAHYRKTNPEHWSLPSFREIEFNKVYSKKSNKTSIWFPHVRYGQLGLSPLLPDYHSYVTRAQGTITNYVQQNLAIWLPGVVSLWQWLTFKCKTVVLSKKMLSYLKTFFKTWKQSFERLSRMIFSVRLRFQLITHKNCLCFAGSSKNYFRCKQA